MGSCSLSRSGTRAPLCWELGVSVAGPPGKSLPRSSLLQISTRPCPACHRAWAPPQRSPPRSPYPTSLSSSAPLLCFLYCWKILFVSFSVARRPHQDSGRACPSCPGPHSLPAPGTGLAQSRCSANIHRPEACRWQGELGTAGLLTGCSLLYALIPHSPSSFLGPLFFFLH